MTPCQSIRHRSETGMSNALMRLRHWYPLAFSTVRRIQGRPMRLMSMLSRQAMTLARSARRHYSCGQRRPGPSGPVGTWHARRK
eukprot:scaffold6241_cov64-Phaeocystis_antarctica.AAC.10